MLYEEIKTKQDLSYISICSLSVLYNSKYILMATSLGANAVVVTRGHCNNNSNSKSNYSNSDNELQRQSQNEIIFTHTQKSLEKYA